jgi:hypothetical protein
MPVVRSTLSRCSLPLLPLTGTVSTTRSGAACALLASMTPSLSSPPLPRHPHPQQDLRSQGPKRDFFSLELFSSYHLLMRSTTTTHNQDVQLPCRWGRTTCPSGSSLVYTGVTAGGGVEVGSGANVLCMPFDVQYVQGQTSSQDTVGGNLYRAQVIDKSRLCVSTKGGELHENSMCACYFSRLSSTTCYHVSLVLHGCTGHRCVGSS